MSIPQRVSVLGVGIHTLDMAHAVRLIDLAIAEGQKGIVCVTGVHGVMTAQEDPGFRSILNNSFLNVPDGRPTVWVGWLDGFSQMRHVPGPQLMLSVCQMSVAKGYSHFLYGGDDGVAEELREMLLRKFPGIRIAGTYTPPFRPLNKKEEAELLEQVGEAKPDVCWVGLSTPKQEKFMAEYVDKLATKLMIGVGAAFDMHTGRINDSPQWMKIAGLAWLHRLCQEPERLWKRYLNANPKFLYRITLQLLHLRSYDPQRSVAQPHSGGGSE